MRKTQHTTVILTKSSQEIKEDLAPIFGLKNILSAGLILFGKLSDKEQKHAIAEANKALTEESSGDKTSLQQMIQMIKEMVEVERQQPGTVFRVLGHEEQRILDEFRKLITPKFKQKKKAK